MPIYEKVKIQTPEQFERIRKALERNLILVEYYRPHSLGGSDYHLFHNFTQFVEYIHSAKTLIHEQYTMIHEQYTIWTIQELLDKKLDLATGEYSELFLISPNSLQAIKNYLKEGCLPDAEILACFSDGDVSEVYPTAIGDYDTFLEKVKSYNHSGGKVYIFPYGLLQCARNQ